MVLVPASRFWELTKLYIWHGFRARLADNIVAEIVIVLVRVTHDGHLRNFKLGPYCVVLAWLPLLSHLQRVTRRTEMSALIREHDSFARRICSPLWASK